MASHTTRAPAILAPLLLAACAPATVVPAPPEPRWHAAGNEPFWAVDASGRQLVFSTPDDITPDDIRPDDVAKAPWPALRATDGTDTVISNGDGAPYFVLRLRAEPCQDSMADRSWSHSATFSHGGKAYVGCAEQVE